MFRLSMFSLSVLIENVKFYYAIILSEMKKNYFVSYIYFYIALMPWNFFNGQMGILTGVLFAWWLKIGSEKGYFKKLKFIFYSKPFVLFFLFVLLSYVSLLWSENFDYAIKSLKFYNYYFLMVPILFTSLTYQYAKNGLYVFLLSIGLYALFSITIFLDITTFIEGSTSEDPKGILAYAIVTPYMAIGFFSSVVLAVFHRETNLRFFFLGLGIVFLIGLFINNGRAGQLSFFMTIITFLVVYRKYFMSSKYFIGAIIICLGGLYSLYHLGKLDRVIMGINEIKHSEERQFEGSWGGRLYMWQIAFSLIQKEPFFGIGIGDTVDEIIKYGEKYPSQAIWIRGFHNQHLDILVKYGIIGYALFLISILLLLYQVREEVFFFPIGLLFFSVTLFDGIGDVILNMKPYTYVFMLFFIFLMVAIRDRNISLKSV